MAKGRRDEVKGYYTLEPTVVKRKHVRLEKSPEVRVFLRNSGLIQVTTMRYLGFRLGGSRRKKTMALGVPESLVCE